MNKIILSSVAVFSFAAAAYAAPAGNGDIILGFWADGGTGATQNVEINTGSTSFFKASQTLGTLTNIGSILSSTYGANWSTRTDLHFGYAGTIKQNEFGPGGEVGRTVYAASTATSSLLDGVQTGTAYQRKSATSQGTPTQKISGLWNLLGSSDQIAPATTDTNSWNFQGGNGGFGNFFAVGTFTNNVDFTSSSYVASDLFEMLPNSASGTFGSYLGTFALFANGDLKFVNTASAIPEPSTYAAILGAAALGFAALRRRQLVTA